MVKTTESAVRQEDDLFTQLGLPNLSGFLAFGRDLWPLKEA